MRLDKTPERDGRTDGQTDTQTDVPWLLQRSALRGMRTRCKNCTLTDTVSMHVRLTV